MQADIRNSLFEGFHCTCFVYGMTGAGKTYTMFGDHVAPSSSISGIPKFNGLINLALREIILQAKLAQYGGCDSEEEAGKEGSSKSIISSDVHLKVSYLEIYNEAIRDLLANNNEPSQNSW